MEFFAELKTCPASAGQIQDALIIERLPELCASIDSVLSVNSPQSGEIYCVWGQFQIALQAIRNGVRLALLNCPHALALTVAAHSDRAAVVVHCTIDDRQADPEFAESIQQFVDDMAAGLQLALAA